MIHSFEPICDKNSKLLILGSMPGIVSLEKQEYYAYPKNSFWFILESIFPYKNWGSWENKKKSLRELHIALWDVLKTCERKGSLDSAIKKTSMFANDFVSLFSESPDIDHIFFNGKRAEQDYKKLVLPILSHGKENIDLTSLPSTSPAHAAVSKEEKLKQWMIIKKIQYLRE